MTDWRSKFRAFAIHLAISSMIAIMAAALVFGLWYPFPYRVMLGGKELFLLVVVVDVVAGPVITFVAFNTKKRRREKILDYTTIGLVQLGALCYGIWTVYEARPVHMVFEYDRFRVVQAFELPADAADKALDGIAAAPLTGPTVLALRPLNGKESFDLTMQAMGGYSLSAHPDLWRPYESERDAVLAAAKPISNLKSTFPMQWEGLSKLLAKFNLPMDRLAYLPIVARNETYWTAVLDGGNGRIIGYLPFNSFDGLFAKSG